MATKTKEAAKKKVIDFNALAQVTDTTFGRASTPVCPTHSVKYKIMNNEHVMVMYICVVNLLNDQQMDQLKKRYSDDANTVINDAVATVKKDYTQETGGKHLSFKQVAEDDSWEVIDLNTYNGKRTAYFRKNVIFHIY
jgi:hypothetical protein